MGTLLFENYSILFLKNEIIAETMDEIATADSVE